MRSSPQSQSSAGGDDPFDLKSETAPQAPPPEPARLPEEPLPDGTVIDLLVTWGREHVQPVQFQGMDIGPFAMTVRVQSGESPAEVYRRTMVVLDQLAEANYQQKLPRFLERVKDSSSGARSRSRG